MRNPVLALARAALDASVPGPPEGIVDAKEEDRVDEGNEDSAVLFEEAGGVMRVGIAAIREQLLAVEKSPEALTSAEARWADAADPIPVPPAPGEPTAHGAPLASCEGDGAVGSSQVSVLVTDYSLDQISIGDVWEDLKGAT